MDMCPSIAINLFKISPGSKSKNLRFTPESKVSPFSSPPGKAHFSPSHPGVNYRELTVCLN